MYFNHNNGFIGPILDKYPYFESSWIFNNGRASSQLLLKQVVKGFILMYLKWI